MNRVRLAWDGVCFGVIDGLCCAVGEIEGNGLRVEFGGRKNCRLNEGCFCTMAFPRNYSQAEASMDLHY